MRIAAHNSFDPLWEGPDAQFETRGGAYAWMGRALNKPPEERHIGMFSIADCKALVEAIWDAFGD